LRLGYFDCYAGAAGDMILAALFDAGLDEAAFVREIGRLDIKGLKINVKDVSRKSIKAKSFTFRHSSGAGAGTYREIVKLVGGANLSPYVKEHSLAAFDLLAESESGIHGVAKQDVHFHEIGSVDTVVDVAGSFIGLDLLGIEEVVCSPISLGTGSVKCAHGVLPVPAPATLRILEGVPVRGTGVERELTTPTGAAILRAGAARFGPMPEMAIERSGYGAGTGELEEMANVIRFVVGESRRPGAQTSGGYERDTVVHIETNIDDMNPQVFAHIYTELFAAGALDVWLTSVVMKKGRPGFVLSVLCGGERVEAICGRIFAETTTAGVRMCEVGRLKLARRFTEVDTRYGKVRVKIFALPGGERHVPEYEDCLHLAESLGIPVQDVIEETRNVLAKSEGASS
jgi:uncharacterized protein (TIGR00299 family) protein